MDFGTHLFDNPIIYTDPNASDFDESHTHGPNIVIVARSYCHDSSNGQNRETCPNSDPSVVHPSKFKWQGQNQDAETARDPCYNDNSTQASELNTDFETAYEPLQQPLSRQSNNLSKIETNDLATQIIPQNKPSDFRGSINNIGPNPDPNYSEMYRY